MGVLAQLILVTCLLTLAAAQESQEAAPQVLSESFEQDDKGSYHYSYKLDNGQQVEESGQVVAGSEPDTGSLEVEGSYSYVGDDGKIYTVTYVANEDGFQPKGDHLPVAPAQIPEYAQLRAEHPELFWSETAQKPADG